MTVPLAVLAIVLAMIMPMPSFLLDLLIAANIAISVIVLMVSMYITRAVEFSIFPTSLLLLTLFRLALNISSTRLILIHGNTGTRAAGQVIEAFGDFVVGGNYIIGVVIFLVLIAIQYVVINHGAVRISEVTARFTLDALPGKQMSIDSDLNAGLIDEATARRRRRELAAEAEFFGAPCVKSATYTAPMDQTVMFTTASAITLKSSAPKDNATETVFDATDPTSAARGIKLTFNQAMDPATLDPSDYTITPAVTLTAGSSGLEALRLSGAFTPGTYTFTLKSTAVIKDFLGNSFSPAADQVIHFTVTPNPAPSPPHTCL